MIKAVIFDMDGLLINSEPLWQLAEIKIFETVGIKLSHSDCLKTMGLRVDEVVQYWYERFPWLNKSLKIVESEIICEVIRLIKEKGEAMPGATYILDLLKEAGLKIGLASSSSMAIIQAAIFKLNIADRFDAIVSAENEEFGKPHPAVYINTAKILGVKSTECLAFEDSVTGLLSATSARMKTIAVPDKENNDIRFCIASMTLNTLDEFKLDMIQKLG